MTFDWFNIFNLDEFEELELVSKTYTFDLEGYGEKDILVTKGNSVNVTFEDEFMPLQFNSENPYVPPDGAVAVYVDENNDVWVGIEVEDE